VIGIEIPRFLPLFVIERGAHGDLFDGNGCGAMEQLLSTMAGWTHAIWEAMREEALPHSGGISSLALLMSLPKSFWGRS
jgi:hypothetical protein